MRIRIGIIGMASGILPVAVGLSGCASPQGRPLGSNGTSSNGPVAPRAAPSSLPRRNYPVPEPGMVGRASEGLFIAASYKAHQRFLTFVGAGDEFGREQLERAGEVIYYSGRLRVVRRLGRDYEVRLLDGPNENQSGWVSQSSLKYGPVWEAR